MSRRREYYRSARSLLPGKSAYTTTTATGNCQNENGLDGYHASTVLQLRGTVQHRQQMRRKGLTSSDTLDYSKLGPATRKPTTAGSLSTTQPSVQRHANLCALATPPSYRVWSKAPGRQSQWMMHRLQSERHRYVFLGRSRNHSCASSARWPGTRPKSTAMSALWSASRTPIRKTAFVSSNCSRVRHGHYR